MGKTCSIIALLCPIYVLINVIKEYFRFMDLYYTNENGIISVEFTSSCEVWEARMGGLG